MENQPTNYELFIKYAQMWEEEFKILLQKLFKENARLNQPLDTTKSDLKKLFKKELDSYHPVEKYHTLQNDL